MSFCPECYAQVEEGAKFCAICGARMPEAAIKAGVPPTPPAYTQPPLPMAHGPRPFRSEHGLDAGQAFVLLCCAPPGGAAVAWVVFSALDEPKKAQHACYIALVVPALLFLYYMLAIFFFMGAMEGPY
ncbi:MAG: zinc-ribbon domain-containing protein [Candidatus Heimdallarchaeota archaeon]